MKKSLIALAVLAASGAAMAQSSVTVYGIVDAYFGSVKDTITTAGSPSQTKVDSGGLKTNRWGLMGSEDLGNGLKANFQLEQGFNSDTGAAGTSTNAPTDASTITGFNRHAWVGLSGGFGSVKLGRTYGPYFALRDGTDNTAGWNIGSAKDTWSKGVVGGYTDTFGNQVQYATPVINGFSGAIAYATGENKDATGNVGFGATNYVSLNAKYVNGPLLLGYAYQSEGQLAGAQTEKYNLLAAQYDFGVAKLTGSYQTAKSGAGKDKDYQLGVSVPFGAMTAYAGYASLTGDNAAGVETVKADGYNVLLDYALSKRTDIYAGYKAVNKKPVGGTKGEYRQLALGIRHLF